MNQAGLAHGHADPSVRLRALMAGFSSTQSYHRATIIAPFLITDGVLAVAEEFKAFWWCDLVASHALTIVRRDHFAVLKLNVFEDHRAEFIAMDGRETPTVYARQFIPFTDFPPGAWTFYLEKALEPGRTVAVMLLPGER